MIQNKMLNNKMLTSQMCFPLIHKMRCESGNVFSFSFLFSPQEFGKSWEEVQSEDDRELLDNLEE